MKRLLVASLLTLTAVLAADQKVSADCRFSCHLSCGINYESTGKCRTFYYHSESRPLPPMCTTACTTSTPACAAYPAPAYGAPAYAAAPVAAAPAANLPAPTAPAASGSSGYTAPQPTPSGTSWAPYASGTQTVGYTAYPQADAGRGSYTYGASSTGYAGYGSGASFQAPSYWYGE